LCARSSLGSTVIHVPSLRPQYNRVVTARVGVLYVHPAWGKLIRVVPAGRRSFVCSFVFISGTMRFSSIRPGGILATHNHSTISEVTRLIVGFLRFSLCLHSEAGKKSGSGFSGTGLNSSDSSKLVSPLVGFPISFLLRSMNIIIIMCAVLHRLTLLLRLYSPLRVKTSYFLALMSIYVNMVQDHSCDWIGRNEGIAWLKARR